MTRLKKVFEFSLFDSDTDYLLELEISDGKWSVQSESSAEMRYQEGEVLDIMAQQTQIRKSNSFEYVFEIPGLLRKLEIDDTYSAVTVSPNAFRTIQSILCSVKRIE